MGTRFKGGASRASIPGGVRKTIENIKEITGQNHSEDEIYAMLKEFSMDPNETTQKLLLLDTFHEVKRKRDRRKEIQGEAGVLHKKMGTGFKGGASRASIPGGVRKTIENIQEITGQNHSEDEIYAMLKECSMDPNETTQKLLLLDTFHEVKRKLDKRKENINKEPTESKWNPGPQSRANRVIRGNYSPRYTSQNTGSGRNTAAVKEDASSHLSEKVTSKVHLATSHDMRKYETSSASPTIVASNGPSGIVSESTNVRKNHASASEGLNQSNTAAVVSTKNSNAPRNKDIKQHQGIPGAVGTIQRGLRTQHRPTELLADNLTESKSDSAKISSSEAGVTNLEEEMSNGFQEVGKNQYLESTQTASSTVSRPSSNYNNRSKVNGSQKVSPGKVWKPKSTDHNIGPSGTMAGSSEVSVVSVGSRSEQQITSAIVSKDATLELQGKLEKTKNSYSLNLIIPNHLHVPEVEKLGFCFGSFDASFELVMNQNVVPGSEKSPPLSEPSKPIDGPVYDLQLSNQIALVAPEDTETKPPDHPHSPSQDPRNFSTSEVEVSSNVVPDYIEPKLEVAPGSLQHPVVHISPTYSYGFMPAILSGQLPSSESSESQARDPSQLPGVVVHQSFDPASYYAQFYRPNLDSDGRISPFLTAGASNKYNTNPAVVSPQTSLTPQELQGGVPIVLSAATSQAPLVTQAAGVMHSSITPTHQPVPVFRQPTGVHLPHYPPNYIPYGHYFPPFYVPPHAIHQFLGNGAFPQQPQAGSLYPTAPGTNVNAKYSISQYKQGPNIGSYGPYDLSMPIYTSGSAVPAVTSSSNDDIAAPQAKENDVYATGQQGGSFYNLPQGQLAFAPSQTGHRPFAFHPGQAVSAANAHHPLLQQSQAIPNPTDTGGVHHNQQPKQLNWPNSY